MPHTKCQESRAVPVELTAVPQRLSDLCAFPGHHSTLRRFSKEKPVPLTTCPQVQFLTVLAPQDRLTPAWKRSITVQAFLADLRGGVWAFGLKGGLLKQEDILG